MFHRSPWVDGPAFGTWEDETSRLIYHDSMPALLSGVPRDGQVLDLGGSNGLSRNYFQHVTTVDLDASAEPDTVADILDYVPGREYDRILLRYVLHYLSGYEVIRLLRHIASYHTGPVHLIQFVDNAEKKAEVSPDSDVRWFRSEAELWRLIHAAGWVVMRRIALEYRVVPEFYLHRLGVSAPAHDELTVSLTLELP